MLKLKMIEGFAQGVFRTPCPAPTCATPWSSRQKTITSSTVQEKMTFVINSGEQLTKRIVIAVMMG